MNLSIRLQALADMVTEGHRLADVGTDHGYVPIDLVLRDRIPSAIAMDINKGPLEKANAHIKAYALESRIETRLSDGLEKLLAGEADTILIAGMGGPLMQRILSMGKHALTGVNELILQPQSEIAEFRHFIHDFGYCILDEQMLEDDHKFYTIFKCCPGHETYDHEMDYLYGHLLITRKDPVLKKFLTHTLQANLEIYEHLTAIASEKSKARLASLAQEINLQKEVLDLL